jgi:tetratricopeptide (TPR) repeat protein
MVEKWLAGNPRAADHLVADGYLWAEAGDLPRAQARLQQALEVDPRNTHALVELGDVYETLNRPDRALALYEKALNINANMPAVTERVRRLREGGASKPRPDGW